MNIENFLISLGIMGKGMLGIFVVIIIIMIIVNLLTKTSSKNSEN
ncbi:MAG TPA: hypothetical protein PLL17_08250 [Defluviitaleaceae bacterium]|nr:hypothetical protein [Defluviitaleaceae bacterium]HPT75193.1 hypothetical protein [Defluviitaleaceae bacterium]HQD51100.1 hypothetical protein [Defluviitaleaceae bacterium]